MFETITSFISDLVTPSPTPTSDNKFSTTFTALIIPADGTLPRFEQVTTVDVSADGNVDRHLVYVPDMRAHWGTGRGWELRDIARVDITNHEVPDLNGCYFGFKSFAMDYLPTSEYSSAIWGDACIVKMAPERYDERGNRIIKLGETDFTDYQNQLPRFGVYEDMPRGALDPSIWKPVVLKLSTV
jgi:hypothetical protein